MRPPGWGPGKDAIRERRGKPAVTGLTDIRAGGLQFVLRRKRRLARRSTAVPPNSPRPRGEGRPMKAARLLVVVLLVCALGLASACGNRSPTGIAPQPAAPTVDLIGSLVGAAGLLQCSNLPYDLSTHTIEPTGSILCGGPQSLSIHRAPRLQALLI